MTANKETNKVIVSVKSKDLSADLINREEKIRNAMKTFYVIGEQLNTIRNMRMYRERGFQTFEAYVNEIFDMSRNYAYKMIDAFCVHRLLTDAGYTPAKLPKTESQCRPMASLVEDQCALVVQVWGEVLKQPKITAAVVTAQVKKALGLAIISDDAKKKKEKQQEAPNPLDILGDNAGNTGQDATQTGGPESTPVATLEAQIEELKAEKLRLESALLKAQQARTTGAPKSKLALEVYKAGFKAMFATASEEEQVELLALRTQLIG